MSQQFAPITVRKFYNRIAEDKFRDNFVKRQPLMQKGFLFKQEPFMGFDKNIAKVIET